MLLTRSLSLLILTASLVSAQPPTYNCDQNACKLPACRCASATPPVPNPPQFLLLTFDDAVQPATWPQAQSLINRKNPNGCTARATWYTQVHYSDPYLVTQWYAQGNEVADHTITHGQPLNGGVPEPFVGNYTEIEGMRKWANELAGIPLNKITGYRFPFLAYKKEALELLSKMGFQYETSMAAQGSEDQIWPYTLDYGAANDCAGQATICGQQLNAKGLWEIPMYGFQGSDGKLHLMDPFNDPTPQAPALKPDQLGNDYRATFDKHYNAQRAPFGVYVHPVWLGKGQPPAVPDGSANLAAIASFLDYALSKPDTWMVTAQQLIEYMKNPVPATQLGAQPYMQCTPNPAPPTNICNGLAGANAAGIAGPETCTLARGAIQTCYGCPAAYPDIGDPSPPSTSARCRVPNTCDTLWWDPVACKCLCTADSCKYVETARPINMDQASLNNVTRNGTGNGNGNGADAAGSKGNGAEGVRAGLGALLAGVAGALVAMI